MLVRVATGFAIGVGMFTVGFLLGRELGRTEYIRDELRRFREERKRAGAGEFRSGTETRVVDGESTSAA